jgi:hypothetical protein
MNLCPQSEEPLVSPVFASRHDGLSFAIGLYGDSIPDATEVTAPMVCKAGRLTPASKLI